MQVLQKGGEKLEFQPTVQKLEIGNNLLANISTHSIETTTLLENIRGGVV